MKRKTTLLITLLLVGSLLLTTACSLTDSIVGKIKDKVSDKIADEMAENFDDVAENLDEDFSFDLDTGEDGSFEFSTEDEDSGGMEDSSTDEFSGSPEIPEDFPSDFCPIYEPAKLIGAEKYGDDATQVYVLMLVTKDDEEMIKDFYSKTNADKDLMEFGMIIFQNEDGTMVGSVQLSEPDQEYAAKGNKTAIMIDRKSVV
jgi:hypothetical protein